MSALKRKIENADINLLPPKVPKTDFGDSAITENEEEEQEGDAGEIDDADDEEDDEDIDEDGYEEDDFLVREDEDEVEGNVDEENSGGEDPIRRKSHKKLKKNSRTFLLDEDDQLLIQETMNSAKAPESTRSSRYDDQLDEIAPTDLGDDSDLNDFIEDDIKDLSEGRIRSKKSSKRILSSRRDGPTYDQIQEAREIFGDGYDDLGDDGYDEFNEDLTGERADDLHRAQTTNFEYIQLVQNFCLDEDEAIRIKDEPERLQMSSFTTRVDLSDLREEAFWIANQLSIPSDFSQLINSIEVILRFVLVEKLEVPFVWLYRRDYFLTELKRDDLWRIFWLDSLWWEIQQKRGKLNQRCDKLHELAVSSFTGAAHVLAEFPVAHYAQFLNQQRSLNSVQDVINYLTLLCEGYSVEAAKAISLPSIDLNEVGSENPKRQNFKFAKYKKYKSLGSVQQFASLICVKSHEIGFSVLHSSPPAIPSVTRSWEDEIADLLASGELPTKEQFLSAATIIVATEISQEPIIRCFARAIFRSRASLSTKPTTRGKNIITPFSQYFGIHLIENKPLDQMFSPDGLLLFMTMIEAESSGLIEIIINPPQKREGDRLIPDLAPFFAEKLRLFQFFIPPVPIDGGLEYRQGWDMLRLKVLEVTVERYLIPFLKADVKSELLQRGKEAVMEECCKEFGRRLSFGPCDKYYEDHRDFITRTLLAAPDKSNFKKVASIFVTQDQPPGLHLAVVDAVGVLIGHQIVSPQLMGQRKDKIKAFLYEYRPDLVVLNSSGSFLSRDLFHLIQKSVIQEIVDTIELDRQLKRSKTGYEGSDDEEEVEDGWKYAPSVVILDDTVPNILKNSSRREILFPDLPSETAAAICLARFAQEPLSEYCSIWRSVDSSYLFGYEVLYMKLHPLQKFVLREKLVERLQCCLINAVSDAGVDINKSIKYSHHLNLLAFIPGLGLRKAESLRQMVQRSVGHIDSRESLLTHKFVGKNVWNNCCGFLKIKARGDQDNPLENTRIHPECYLMYDFAPKICADALGCESNPSRYSDTVSRLMKSVRHDLEKRISKFPEWLDLWEKGKPEYFLDQVDSTLQISHSKISVELQDCLFTLLLDEYVQELENRGKGKRRIQFEQIKEELRYPWLDLRKPQQSLSAAELFDIIYGESSYSLFVGLKTGFTVLETQDQTYYEGRDNNIRRRQRATVKIDAGIKGYINSNEISDDDYSNQLQLSEKLKVGDTLVGTIIGIYKDKFYVELSIKPSLLDKGEVWWMENRNIEIRARRFFEQLGKSPLNLFDEYFNEKEALTIARSEEQSRIRNQAQALNTLSSNQTKPISKESGGNSINARVIYHPLFANVTFKEAEEKLKREKKGAGAVVIRPSSRGFNYLSLTWAFQENMFKHIIIEEHGKRPNDLGLGARLIIRDDNCTYEYSDLDELYAMYIEPLNDLVSAMTKHLKFRFGSAEEVEALMREESRNQPGRIPYFIRLDKEKPGSFILTWLPGRTSQSKLIRVELTPKGYRVRNEIFARPSELILWFKKMNEGNR